MQADGLDFCLLRLHPKVMFLVDPRSCAVRSFCTLAFNFLLALGLLAVQGCAVLPPPVNREPSQALPASPTTALGAATLVASAAHPGLTGVRAMPQATIALDARLTLARQAQTSLDVQYYHLGNDETGHLMLRELRDAASRGVRVRLLIDDFYTEGMDHLLLGLASYPNVQVRIFNPFGDGRGSQLGRLLGFAGDFKRLNHRMHNKLFIADSAVAIAGGRNLADGYFLRGNDNFIDFDALLIGAVLPQLSTIFDVYWNSEHVWPIASLTSPSDPPESLRAAFDNAVASASETSHLTLPERDVYGVAPASADLAATMAQLIWAPANAFADAPDKVVKGGSADNLNGTVTFRSLTAFRQARSELMLISPYFVPGKHGMERLADARRHNISVRIITNGMAATDEPLASLAYERYRVPMLKMGIELYEVSPRQIQRDPTWRASLGSARAHLHAKLALIDRKSVILGSMNLDQRSATTNTELAVQIDSPELAARILTWFNAARQRDIKGGYQVKLKPDGEHLQWVPLNGDGGAEPVDQDPEDDLALRIKLFFMSLVVSEDLL